MNHYYTSDGERITQATLDRRIQRAKKLKLELADYPVCEDCHRNDCIPVDCSHDKSVQWCKNNRCAELAYDLDNITLRGRKCHRIHDKSI